MRKNAHLFETPEDLFKAVKGREEDNHIESDTLSMHRLEEYDVQPKPESDPSLPVERSMRVYLADMENTALSSKRFPSQYPWDKKRDEFICKFDKQELVRWLSRQHGIDMSPLLCDDGR